MQGFQARKLAVVLISCLTLLGTGLGTSRASAEASKIATSLGDLRWGMSEHDVSLFVKRKIDEHYSELIAKAHDARKKDSLRSEAKREKDEVERGLVSFDGRSRWDSSAIAGEFRTDNSESMIVYEDGSSQNYYFFLNGRLWKWYKAFDSSSFGQFKKFQQSIEKKFGKGHAKTGELNPGAGKTQWLEYLDRNSRLRAADNTKRGVFALIFDEMATVREIAASHPAPKRSSYADEDEAKPAKSSEHEEVARAGNTHRSIFADEQKTESESEYNARRQKLARDERAAQERMHQRKEDAKRGEVLKQVDAVNDSDPLSGL